MGKIPTTPSPQKNRRQLEHFSRKFLETRAVFAQSRRKMHFYERPLKKIRETFVWWKIPQKKGFSMNMSKIVTWLPATDPLPAPPSTQSSPSKRSRSRVDFGRFDQNWPKTVENEQKRLKIDPKIDAWEGGLTGKMGGSVARW